MPNTATKEQVSKDLDDMSSKIGGLVRATALGVLAVGWGFLVTPNHRIYVWPWAILTAIALAFVALLLDWAQYLAAYLNSERTWHAMEQDDKLRGWTPDWLYNARDRLFYAKQAATAIGAAVLVAAMLPAIVRLVSQQP
jgi:hypothetical protein